MKHLILKLYQKKHFLLCLLAAGFFSCFYPRPKETTEETAKKIPKGALTCGEWVLSYSNDNGWSRQGIICDSLQMISAKEAYVYVKGVKTHIFADKLYPIFVPCK